MKRVIRFYIPKGSAGKDIKAAAIKSKAAIRKVGTHDVIVFSDDCGVEPILQKIANYNVNVEATLKTKLLQAGIDISKK